MKAHVRGVAAPLALLYGVPVQEADAAESNVYTVLARLGIDAREIGPDELDETVATLTNAGGAADAAVDVASSAGAAADAAVDVASSAGAAADAVVDVASSADAADDADAADGTDAADVAVEKGPADAGGPAPVAQLLLMADFPDALLNRLLAELRIAEVPPMLKAIVTKHNKAWTVRALLTELLREKQKFQKNKR